MILPRVTTRSVPRFSAGINVPVAFHASHPFVPRTRAVLVLLFNRESCMREKARGKEATRPKKRMSDKTEGQDEGGRRRERERRRFTLTESTTSCDAIERDKGAMCLARCTCRQTDRPSVRPPVCGFAAIHARR